MIIPTKLPSEETASKFLKTLLGDIPAEASGLVSDRIRLWRFERQAKCVHRAEQILREAGLNAQRVPLRILFPLLDGASNEEDDSLHTMWATLLANVATSDKRLSLHSICVDVLKGISPQEAFIMEALHSEIVALQNKSETEKFELAQFAQMFANRKWDFRQTPYLSLDDFREKVRVDPTDFDLACDNLARFNLLSVEAAKNLDGIDTRRRLLVITRLGVEVISRILNSPKATEIKRAT